MQSIIISESKGKIKFKECLSIIICTKDNERIIERSILATLKALRYLSDKVNGVNYELIIVYAPSHDNTLVKIKSILNKLWLERSSLIIFDEGKGLGYARQLGFSISKCPIVIYADGDKILTQKWIYIALTKLLADERLAGISDLPFILGDSFIAKIRNGYLLAYYIVNSKLKQWFGVSSLHTIRSGNSAWKRKYLKIIGGFSSRFKKADEDVDVSLRMREKGLKLDIVNAISLQSEDHSLKDLVNIFRYQGLELNRISLYNKRRDKIKNNAILANASKELLSQKIYLPLLLIFYPIFSINMASYFKDPILKSLVGIQGVILWPLFVIIHKLVVAVNYFLLKT
ncbi:MAG: glycosyltransferase family 2 protein [Desulfurococcales archaeon]|nr:glycosyltransferase family 2 protein [Desulfurococcales archaeon]